MKVEERILNWITNSVRARIYLLSVDFQTKTQAQRSYYMKHYSAVISTQSSRVPIGNNIEHSKQRTIQLKR